MTQAGSLGSNKIPGYPYHLALMTAFRGPAPERVDIVIFDLSPSISTFNKTVLTSCDFFLVPSFGDFSSVKAIGTLEERLVAFSNIIKQKGFLQRATETRWNQTQQAACRYELPIPKPRFLGIALTRFSLLKGNQAPAALEAWLTRTREASQHMATTLKAVPYKCFNYGSAAENPKVNLLTTNELTNDHAPAVRTTAGIMLKPIHHFNECSC
jgi:hypothetical protein